MNVESLTRQFARIGADLEVLERPAVRGRNGNTNFSLDIRLEGKKEFYLLEVAKPSIESVDFLVLNARRDLRHLLLMARDESQAAMPKEKFLCGHDERHWFVASLPGSVPITDVNSAIESLKPGEARISQWRNRVAIKDLNKRHNAGFIRQGEWFFVPTPEFRPGPMDIIRKDEPISRGAGSKPHMVSELLRRGGEQVYVNRRTQHVLSVWAYHSQMRSGKIKNSGDWTEQRLTSLVYVRGKVSHADHKTILLEGWHRVAMNAEPLSNSVRFLD